MTLEERQRIDLEQEMLGMMGKPPNAAEWEVFHRRESESWQGPSPRTMQPTKTTRFKE